MTYLPDQLSVKVHSGFSYDFTTIPDVTNSVHIFPNADDDLFYLYVIYVVPAKLDSVMNFLSSHPDIEYCERIPVRKLI